MTYALERLDKAEKEWGAFHAQFEEASLRLKASEQQRSALEEVKNQLEEDLKVIVARSHLKNKYDLFKECEVHGGKEGDFNEAFTTWETLLTSDDEDDGEVRAPAGDGDGSSGAQ